MRIVPTPAACPRCNGSGWIPLPGDSLRVEPCGCQGDLRRQQRIAGARIPKRYEECTLESFVERSVTLRNAKKRVEDFIDEWPNPASGKGLLLMGPCGSGKTHLAVGALLGIIKADKPGRVIFENFSDLIQEIQATFDSDGGPSKSELLHPLIHADLLVIDELGAQKPTPWVQDILYYVINSRYNEARTTIFTTNYFDQPAESSIESLQGRIGVPLRSRIYEMAWRIDFAGVKDYRPEKW
jgi:DNA replication protein DnaC